MAIPHFNFEQTTIGKVLKEGSLVVPPNQRSYSWEEQHITNLLHDFDEAVSEKADYFLGTIVLVQGDRQSIQDGQQRLATTTILLARIRDQLRLTKREVSAQSVDADFVRTIDRNTEERVARLTLNAEDNNYFSRSIITGPGEEGFALKQVAMRQSNQRMARASEIVQEFITDKLKPMPAERQVEWLLQWVTFIEKDASVVVVTVSDEVNAYRIFETLNDRGLKASQADILKNYFFSKVGARLPEAQSMWNFIASNMETVAGNEGDRLLLTYIRHFWITEHGQTKERELAALVRTEVTGQAQTMKFLSACSAAVGDYLALSNPGHHKWDAYPASVRKNVETIAAHLQVEQIRPLLFAVAMKFDPLEAEKAFKLFVSWSVRFLIVGGRGGMLDQQYSLRAFEVGTGKITKARDLREAMKKYVPPDKEFQEAFESARVSRAHLARYYLRAIEKTMVADPHPEYVANDDVKDVNLEHILPLTPGPEWGVDEDTARAAQKLLGNMVLVSAVENAKMGNAIYAKKRDVLRGSAFLSTKAAGAAEDWSMEAIKARQAQLAAHAVTTWTLTFAEERPVAELAGEAQLALPEAQKD